MTDTTTRDEIQAVHSLVTAFADLLHVERDRVRPLASGELKGMTDDALIALDALTFALARWLEHDALLRGPVRDADEPSRRH